MIAKLSRHAVGIAAVLLAPVPAGAQVPRGAGVSPTRHDAPPAKVVLPGFETLDDGSTRLFVDLSAPVAFEAKPGNGTITYILKHAQATRRNNCNPLVTAFFNTPVTLARLEPHGRDLWFVVEVRAPVQPAVSVDPKGDPKNDGGATLSIRFPKGDYLPSAAGTTEPAPARELGTSSGPAPATAPIAPLRAAPTRRPHAGGGGGARSRRHSGGTLGN